MKCFHPRRFIRRLPLIFSKARFFFICHSHRVKCNIGENSSLKNCTVFSKGDGEIIIGEGCNIKNTVFKFYGKGGRIIIKDNVKINALPEAKTILAVKNSTSISIDDGCLLSNSIDISTTDWHIVLNDLGERINHDKDVHIYEHVWIGRKVTVFKGVSVLTNSIIGACSVVTKSFDESNVVIAGNPAIIRKKNVFWK